jgi:hypothetical protein
VRSKSVVVVTVAVVALLAVGMIGVTLLLRERSTPDDAAAEPAANERPSNPASSPAPHPSGTLTPSTSGVAIRTSKDFYFGRPYETIAISGRYVGAEQATELRVQVLRPGGWQTFPLPAVTKESGRFRAYVELGGGQYRLRLVDPATGTRSGVVTVLLF